MSTISKVLASCAATLAFGFSLMAVTAPARAQGPGGAYCASNDNHYARCQVPWRDAELIQQSSKASCIRGQTWGFDRGSIWVDRGCRGQFAPARGGGWQRGPGPAYPPDRHDHHHAQQVRCESRGNSQQRCPADIRRSDDVHLVRQLSGASCTEGRTWGWSRDGIWVDRGCRADFEILRDH